VENEKIFIFLHNRIPYITCVYRVKDSMRRNLDDEWIRVDVFAVKVPSIQLNKSMEMGYYAMVFMNNPGWINSGS
jgi:hypothetical protein